MFQLTKFLIILAFATNCLCHEHTNRFKRQALVDRLGQAASGALTGFANSANSPTRNPTISGKLKGSTSTTVTSPSVQPGSLSLGVSVDDEGALDEPEVVDKPPKSRRPSISSSLSTSISGGATKPNVDQPNLDIDLDGGLQASTQDQGPKRKPPRQRPSSSSSFAISSNKKNNKDYNYEEDIDDNGSSYYDDNYHSGSHRSKSSSSSSYDDDRDDDLGDDYHSGSGFMRMAAGPMFHMKEMFASLFDRMEDGIEGGASDGGAGPGEYAAASTYSTGDGYARSRSIVNNNGRMRGVESETRNGRTRTRRIGPNSDRNDRDD